MPSAAQFDRLSVQESRAQFEVSAASIDQRQQSNESYRKQIENPTETKSQQRSAYLKSEVKQFLQDKQLLRQLEQSQNSRAVELLRT